MSRYNVGIEKINIYGNSLLLDQRKLAIARNKDPDAVANDFLIHTRSLAPPYEDAITMGANAAKPLLDGMDRDEIGFLVVGTETATDYGKPISTNIHEALRLPSSVRNFETKHACYGGTAAMSCAVNWIASKLNRGRKALVISTDFSRAHFGLKQEFVTGGAAAAAIVGDNPSVLKFEPDHWGTCTTNIYDTYRPTAKDEMGNNEVSLFTYSDMLEGAYLDYRSTFDEPIDPEQFFKYISFHTPFPGVAFHAHRSICNITRRHTKKEITESFERMVMPSLYYSRKLGSTYGASNMAGLCSLATSCPDLVEGDRIGFYAYGSGAIGEFYSGHIGPQCREIVASMKIDEAFASRREVSVDEYEDIETTKASYIDNSDFEPDLSILDGWYDKHYVNKGLLALKRVKDFIRVYEWA